MGIRKKGGFINQLPEWVDLKIINDYSKVFEWVMGDPKKVIIKQVKIGRVITAFRLAITHLILKITDDRTLYYNVVLSKMKSVQKQYDVAIAYSGPMDFITAYILKKVNAFEKIQWIHFDVSKFNFNDKFAKRNYPQFDKIVVVSQIGASNLITKVPNVKDKISVISNFLPAKSCLKQSDAFNPYKKWDNSDKVRILTVGRLTLEKGQIIIPSVVKKLLDDGYENFVWFIVGEGIQRKNRRGDNKI